MISQEDFDALKKRVSDLEEAIAEEIKIFHNMSGTLKAQSDIIEKVPALIERVAALASIVEDIKPEAG